MEDMHLRGTLRILLRLWRIAALLL